MHRNGRFCVLLEIGELFGTIWYETLDPVNFGKLPK